MKRFQFPLQPVMEWRGRKAEEEKSALELLRRTEAELEATSEALRSEMGDLTAQLSGATRISSEQLHEFTRFRRDIQRRTETLAAEQHLCREQIGRQQERCVEADRAHRLLVKVKERQHKVWKYDADRENEQTAADLYLAQWNRSSAAN